MNLRAFSVANLASPQILPEHKEPWVSAPAVPQFENRKKYQEWMGSPDTLAPLFSLVEGVNGNLRASATNEPYRVHGVVADFDAVLEPHEIAPGLARTKLPIYAWNRTRRGGARVVFAFEKPVWYYGRDTFTRLMNRARKEIGLDGLFAALDFELLTDPFHCYVAGNNWTIPGGVIPVQTVGLWLFDALKSTSDFKKSGIEIPLDRVEAEMRKQFPGRWNGPFVEGARGLRFWAPEADNPTAAIVRKTGMTAFTGDRPFLSWADIFGAGFVKQYQEDRIGRAVTEMYCDAEKRYYRLLPGNVWDACDVSTARRHLKIQYGLTDKEDPSEVDLVLHSLECNNRVAGLLPFPHRHQMIVEWNGNRYLNSLSDVILVQPNSTSSEWAVEFPYLADYLMTLFADQQNLEVFLSWLKVWYEGCLAGSPTKGQALFVAGPTGTGKSMLSLCVLAEIFGGYAAASKFFVDSSQYNSAIFEKALWTLDDQLILGDRKKHQKFSGLIKAVVANPSFSYEKKWGYAGDAPFEGRFVTTLNEDPVSLSILPDTDLSMLDKVTLLRTGEAPAVVVGSVEANRARVQSELPAFLAWLVAWEIPAWIERDSRFGIKSWQDPIMLAAAQESSESNSLVDALALWTESMTDEKSEWKGSASALLCALKDSASNVRSLIGNLNAITFGRILKTALNTNPVPWVERKTRRNQAYYIIRKANA